MYEVRRSLAVVTALTFVGCIVSGSVHGQPVRRPTSASPESVSGYEKKFDQIWEAIRDRFYDKDIHGLDWKKIGETYRAKLSGVRSKSDFEDLANRMLNELHASHTSYVTDDDIEFYMLPAVMAQDMQGHQTEHIGIMGHQEAKEFMVAGVLEGGPAQNAGIISGDRLLLADGLPFSSSGSFRGKAGMEVRVTLRREGEAPPRSVVVTPVKQNILRAFLSATESSARVVEHGGKKIGYVHLWTMANEAFKRVLDNLVQGKLHDTDGLILDLRDGYGGSPFGYSDVFYRPDVLWEQHGHGQRAFVQHTGYNKPMVVLINGGTRSAKEFFAYQLKSSRRATLIGTRTAGAFLGAGAVEIGKDGLLELAVIGLKVDGKLLENNGVEPDIVVASRAAYSDHDSQFAAAMDKIADLTSRPGGSSADSADRVSAH